MRKFVLECSTEGPHWSETDEFLLPFHFSPLCTHLFPSPIRIPDALPLSMELRGSDLETSDLIPAHYWDRIFTTDERARKAAMSVICRALRSSLQSTSSVFEHSIPRLVRLLSECPYQDIHDSIHELLTMVQKVRKKAKTT